MRNFRKYSDILKILLKNFTFWGFWWVYSSVKHLNVTKRDFILTGKYIFHGKLLMFKTCLLKYSLLDI